MVGPSSSYPMLIFLVQKRVARLVASLGLWLLPPGVTHLLDEDPSYSTEAC